MVLYGNSLASFFFARPDRPNPADFTPFVGFLVGATFTHTKSGINRRWCRRAPNYLKLYFREIMALHSGMNVTTRVIHGAVNRRLTDR